MNLNQAIEKYGKLVKVTKSKGTYRYFIGKVGILKKYLGDIDCSLIDDDVLIDFIVKQKERNPDISNKTINKYIQMLKQILEKICKIIIVFDKLSETKKIIVTIPESIIQIIYNYYENNQKNVIQVRNFLIIRLFNESGLRLSELANLKFNDFEMINQVIHVKRTKTNTERYVFYTKETNDLLHKYLMISRIDNYLFVNFTTGAMLSVYSIETITTRLKNKLNIQQSISPHKWRHTFATRFVKKNGNMEVLRQILGHSSLRTTQKYLHLDKDSLLKEYVRVNKITW